MPRVSHAPGGSYQREMLTGSVPPSQKTCCQRNRCVAAPAFLSIHAVLLPQRRTSPAQLGVKLSETDPQRNYHQIPKAPMRSRPTSYRSSLRGKKTLEMSRLLLANISMYMSICAVRFPIKISTQQHESGEKTAVKKAS